jgi:histidine triad (HIT) family protein
MADCLFCKIASGAMKVPFVAETPDLVAFRDIQPKAPVHVLVIPRRHLASLNEVGAAESGLAGSMLALAARIAAQEKIDAAGYRTVINCGGDGGQTVFHLHLHLLGGRPLAWPPG